jgi:uncharacterized protein
MTAHAADDLLPQQVDALKLADAGARLAGICRVDSMDRLDLDRGQALVPVVVELDFSRELNGHRVVRGRIGASLPRICQRCLRPMTEHLDLQVLWALAADDVEAQMLDASYEAVLRADTPLAVHAAVEDELVLSAALAPRHEESSGDCLPGPSHDSVRDSGAHPFAVLRRLKSD